MSQSSGSAERPPVVERDGQTLVFEEDKVFLDQTLLAPRAEQTSLLFHKPKSVTTTANDPDGKQDLSRWLAQMSPGIFPVGRLDRATTGALLFTTDGDLANALLHPDHGTEKLYWLWLNEHLKEDDPRLAQMCSGIPMLGSVARAERVEVLHGAEDYTELLVTLREGKNRQIRRMCRALDLRLLHLHRRQIGGLSLGDLAPGEFRSLSSAETEDLWKSLGGRQAVTERQIKALRGQAEKERLNPQSRARLTAWLSEH